MRRVAAVVAAVLTVGAAAVVLRSSEPERAALPALVDITPAAVQRLVVEADGRQAELTRAGPAWSAVERLFPLLAYRVLEADPGDPQYGLVDPVAVVRLHDTEGGATGVRFGAATFSSAGFYARHDARPDRVYLVPRNTVDVLRSLITGQRTTSADPLGDQAGRYRAERQKVEEENSVPVFLRQVIDTGAEMPPSAP